MRQVYGIDVMFLIPLVPGASTMRHREFIFLGNDEISRATIVTNM